MNLAAVEEQTRLLVDAGHRVLQIHRFAGDEQSHVARLERWAELPHGARVIDMGSGVGEMARVIGELRPDLTFCLVNISPVQLAYSPPCERRCCSFLSVPEPDASFDAAMFCFSIGHENALAALREAARLLKRDGVLFVYDMARVAGDNRALMAAAYSVNSRELMEAAAQQAGFTLDFYMEPKDSGEYGRAVLGEGFQAFAGTIPAVWRFIRC